MKVLVAVSGGVDSVVLLDILVRSGRHQLVVAHFDHGMRDDSAEDARFVAGLARYYGLPCVVRREELGKGAGEALARQRRYRFLRRVSAKYKAVIATAHHMNDIAETMAINVQRGTGWRGVAVLDSDIRRPLLAKTKQELLDYALHHHLEWVEDSTNQNDAYLRNRLRRRLTDETVVRAMADLRNRQIDLKRQIDRAAAQLIVQPYGRYFFSQIDNVVALECLRVMTKACLTRPQLERLLLAIKTYKPGARYQAGGGVIVDFTTRHFSLEMVK